MLDTEKHKIEGRVMTEKNVLHYDLIILGGGPAGLSAALYASRGELKTAIIDTGILGGQVNNTLEIENYPGFGIISGLDLVENIEKHVDKFNVDKHILQEIVQVELTKELKTIETEEFVFKANSVILATGAQPKKLNVPGENEFAGRGVSYCAVCDGAFFKEKDVCVVGGGNTAVEEALYLTKYASSVSIIHRRNELRADKIYQKRAENNPKIKFVWDSVVTEILGEQKVEKLLIKNVKDNKISEIKADGVFPYIGFSPNSDIYNGQIELDQNGFIKTDEYLSTSNKGVYVAGDVRVTPLRQVIVAVADGAISATSAIKYIEENNLAIVK